MSTEDKTDKPAVNIEKGVLSIDASFAGWAIDGPDPDGDYSIVSHIEDSTAYFKSFSDLTTLRTLIDAVLAEIGGDS